MKLYAHGFVKLTVIFVFLAAVGAAYWFSAAKSTPVVDNKLLTFSSENYPGQFNFFQFQYPEGWDPNYIDAQRIYIVKQDGPAQKISSYADIEKISNTYIELHMSGDEYTEAALKKNFPIKSIRHKTIADRDVLVWTMPASLEDAARKDIQEYTLNYTFATKYTNKNNVTFMLRYKAGQNPKKEDVQALEMMVKTFTVMDSPAPKKLGDVPSANAQFSVEEAAKAIALSFEQYKAAILSQNGEQAVRYLDQRTINHYYKLRLLVLTFDKDMLQKQPVLDQISVLLTRAKFSKVELDQAVNGKAMLMLAIDKGMIGENSVKSISVGATGVEEDKKTGYVQVKYANGSISPLKIIARLEENQWKIDLTSMFPGAESAIRKKIEKSGLTTEKFISDLVSKTLGKPMSEDLWVAIEK